MNTNENINKYINKIETIFKNLTNDYNSIILKLPNLLLNDILSYDHLLDIEVSMTDLSIHIQSILFIIEKSSEGSNGITDSTSENSNEIRDGYTTYKNKFEEEYINKQNTDKLVDTTLCDMMPLFFLYLMMIDTKSILKSKTFGKSINKQRTTKSDLQSEINSNTQNNKYNLYNMYIPEIELD